MNSVSPSKMMDVSDVLCNICLEILLEPVTLPCRHRFCKGCFDRSIEVNSLTCPNCKRRIGIWARKNAKNQVDQDLWRKIQEAFPERVNLRLQGVELNQDEVEELFPCVPMHQHVEAGEIGEEFRKELTAFQEEEEQRRRLEAEDGAGMIITQETVREQEEALRRIEQEREDEALARALQLAGEQVASAAAASPRVLRESRVRKAEESPAGKSKDGKRLRQMSLQESFQPRQK